MYGMETWSTIPVLKTTKLYLYEGYHKSKCKYLYIEENTINIPKKSSHEVGHINIVEDLQPLFSCKLLS